MTARSFIEARDFLFAHRTDYETAYRDFKWPVLDRFNWALDYFDPMARDNHAPALHIVNENGDPLCLSFAQMSERSARVANHLRALNVKRGERILLMLPNRVELWETMLAAMKLGAIVLPATTQLATGDLRDRIALGRVQHVIADSSETHKFDGIDIPGLRIAAGVAEEGWLAYDDACEASPIFIADTETKGSDPYLLYFTSGTTSKPKLVAHTHQSYPVGHLSTMYWIGLQPGDVHWNISSPGWAKHAWSCFFAPWNAQACVFIYNFARFDAARALQKLVQYDVTTLCAPPTVWRMLVQEPLKSYAVKLREIVGAGEPLNPEIIERVQNAWGLPIRDGYGQTETTAQIANTPGQRVVPGSMGRPLPGYRVALLDPDGARVEEGEVALELNPPPLGLMTGYIDNPVATDNAMRSGVYRTSDIASRSADGYYTYVGRADDVFKSSDYRLSPFELESVLIEHEAIAEAAVVPSPDPLRLSVPKAFVTLRHGYSVGPELARSVFAFSRERLAPYKRIRRLEFAELPKTISGKIRRVDLRRQEAARAQDGARGEFEYREEDFPELKQ
jgi:acetyl-CoA synthetase